MPKFTLRAPITILVTMEGLTASSLPCYGCSWNQTPAIDRLAAGGVVWDRWTSPIDQPGGLIRRWRDDSRELISKYSENGQTVFLSDDQNLGLPDVGLPDVGRTDVDRTDDATGFHETILLRPAHRPAAAKSSEETWLAQTFAAVSNAIESDTRLVWLHSAALRECWDAPVIDEPNDDEFDTPPHDESLGEPVAASVPFQLPATTSPPTFQLSADDDPDQLFAWMNRYAAQVRLLDQMILWLGESLAKRKPTIVLAGASGFSFGENGWVGHHVGPLRSTDIRLPLIVSSGGPLRVGSLQSAAALPSVLQRLLEREPVVSPTEWCRSEGEFQPSIQTESDRASKAVTTSRWFYVNDSADGSFNTEKLYLKPDDANDANDISRLRREVVDQFDNLQQPST